MQFTDHYRCLSQVGEAEEEGIAAEDVEEVIVVEDADVEVVDTLVYVEMRKEGQGVCPLVIVEAVKEEAQTNRVEIEEVAAKSKEGVESPVESLVIKGKRI